MNSREAENYLEDHVQLLVGINDDLETIRPDVEDIKDILFKLKNNNSPSNDRLPAELFKAGHHKEKKQDIYNEENTAFRISLSS